MIEADATSVLTVHDEEHKIVYCGTAFGLEDWVKKETSPARPMIVRRRYTASADSEDFRERLNALARRMGVLRATLPAFIGDGAPYLWDLARELFPGEVLIQASWDLCDDLKGVLKGLFGETERGRQLYEK